MRRTVLGSLILAALLSAGLSRPNTAEAQEPQTADAVSAAELASYARAYAEIDRLRDELRVQLAEPANKAPVAQAEIREAMHERRLQIIRSHDLTEDAYARITFAISTDDTQREAFREAAQRVSDP